MSAENDADSLTPLQEMVTEVLVARWRLGERRWPFPASCNRALNALARRGLVTLESGPTGDTRYVQLTPAGQRRYLTGTYTAPLTRLAEGALFLRQNGERPPGGSETWHHWDRQAERVLHSTQPDMHGYKEDQ